MGEFAKLLLAWLASPVRALGALMIASWAALWLWRYPEFANAMRDPFWRWPIIVLMISSAGLATYPVEVAWKRLAEKRKQSAYSKRIIARLSDLTPHEKKVLGRYLMEERTTAPWGRAGGTVDTLARDGILSLLVSDPNTTNPIQDLYAINDVAWKHLQAHPELIDLEPQ